MSRLTSEQLQKVADDNADEFGPSIVFHDRYSATGTPYPDPATVCFGDCEGMGFHPLRCWCRGTIEGHRPDEMSGWCFKTCADCNGTGKRAAL